MSNAGARFYPSGCGGHKNSENVATFSKFLGREEKPRLCAEITGKTSPPQPELDPQRIHTTPTMHWGDIYR